MAVAHLSVKVGRVGKGLPHAQYIMREGRYKERLNQGEKLEFCESGNMPRWAEKNPALFWQSADLHERKNGSVYREHEIALPRELTKEQRIELVQAWVKSELGERHAYTWAIHNKMGLDNQEQPHLHLMFSDRLNDGIERNPEYYFKRFNAKNPEKGGCQKANFQAKLTDRKEALKELRLRWEKLHNEIMKKHGFHEITISMLSYKNQGIDKVAQPKMLPSETNYLHQKNAIERAVKNQLVNPLERLDFDKRKALRLVFQKVKSKQTEELVALLQNVERVLREKRVITELERREIEQTYQKHFEGLNAQEENLEQLRSKLNGVTRQQEQLELEIKLLQKQRREGERQRQTVQKRLQMLETAFFGQWRHKAERERLQAYLNESQKKQTQHSCEMQELGKRCTELMEVREELQSTLVKGEELLAPWKSSTRDLGRLKRLVMLDPSKRKNWMAVEEEMVKRYEGFTTSSIERNLNQRCLRFARELSRNQGRDEHSR